MGRLEDMFKEEKNSIDNINAPEELEDRLREALKHEKRKAGANFSRWAAAAAILILIGSYSFDAMAYYGKKILGYDNVTQGNLGRLNELGKGQEIEKSCNFSDGTEITLSGIFFDENKLVVFFRIKGYNGNLPHFELDGIREYFAESGYGSVDGDILHFIQEFETPDFYEKWMKINISKIINNKMETREIKFTLDRNKAINQVIKQDISKSIEIDGIKVHFESISGSPLYFEVRGNASGGNFDSKDGREYKSVEFDLYINDKNQTVLGGGNSSQKGFHREFDGVEEDIKSLEIRNIMLVYSEMVDRSIPVDYSVKDLALVLGKTPIIIKEMIFDGENTILRLETPRNVEIPVGLLVENSELEYLGEEYKDVGDKAQQIYRFNGRGKDMKLLVKEIRHLQKSSGNIGIPVGE